MKTNKSFTKRIKVTKKGKILARKPGQNHFNAKESGEKNLSKRGLKQVGWATKRVTRRFLPKT